MCKSQFGQRASGLVCTTQECASAGLVNVRVEVFITSECASVSLVNVQVVQLYCASEHEMCEC